MPSSETPVEMLGGDDEHYVAHPLCHEGKVQPFEKGMDDSYLADADASSHTSDPSSGGGGETTDVAGSPLLQHPTTTDDEVEHETAPCVTTPPLLSTRHSHPVRLSSSAPPSSLHSLLGDRTVPLPATTTRVDERGPMHKAARSPQTSPSLRCTTPPSVSNLVPRTPPPDLRYQYNPKAIAAAAAAAALALPPASPPQQQPPQTTPRMPELVAPVVAVEVPLTPTPPLPASVTAAAPSEAPTTSSRIAGPPAPSPRKPPVHEEEPDVCCICLEEYSLDNPMFRGECRHHFHLPCLMEWKQRSNTCPMCCAETLHGVGDLPTPLSKKPVDPAEAARRREMVQRDEAFAQEMQRKYLLRAQQQQQQARHRASSNSGPSLSARASHAPRAAAAAPAPAATATASSARAAPTTRVSGNVTPGRSPQMRPQRNITPLPPLAAATPASRAHPTHMVPAQRTQSGQAGAAATTNAPPQTSAASSKKRKAVKSQRNATPASSRASGESRPRSTSPAVHPHFKNEQRPRRRSGQNGCTVM